MKVRIHQVGEPGFRLSQGLTPLAEMEVLSGAVLTCPGSQASVAVIDEDGVLGLGGSV